jgi:glycine/D-amino acid oxidase-like deaminating enzyme
LLAAVFGAAGVTCLPVRVAALQPGAAHGWSLLAEDGRVLAQADRVILANALGAGRLLETVHNAANFPRLANATPLAGEVYDYPAYPASPPAAIIAGNGYWLPAVNGYPLVGSTYRRHGEPAPLTQAGRDEVFDKVRALVPASSTWLAPAGVPSGAVSGGEPVFRIVCRSLARSAGSRGSGWLPPMLHAGLHGLRWPAICWRPTGSTNLCRLSVSS